MITLGLNISGYIASAALVENGNILAAAAEERFSRIKRDRTFPRQAVEACLKESGRVYQDIKQVAISWNPGRNLSVNAHLASQANRVRVEYLAYLPNALASIFPMPEGSEFSQHFAGMDVRFIDHHLAHAACAGFTSPFEQAAVVTVDAFGENDAIAVGLMKDGDIALQHTIRYPNSPGSFYSYFTRFLGFQADADEYKVMALGAYADTSLTDKLEQKIAETFEISVEDGRLLFHLDLSLFDFYLFHRPSDFSPLERHLGISRRRVSEELSNEHFALASALQRNFERIINGILDFASQSTGEQKAVFSGGCFMNSVANGKIAIARKPFESIFIPPYPDDSGGAIGAALYASLKDSNRNHSHNEHNFFGPSVHTQTAEALCNRNKLPFTIVENTPQEIARRVADGQIVGVARGRMEFGQRALGNRSILANPSDPEIRNKINGSIKMREWFRPYAVSIKAERVQDVFEVADGFQSPFMEKVATVREDWQRRIAGVLHADKSVRIHTVSAGVNPELYAILEAFEDLSGLPLILNTSFNVAGEPMVCNESDALSTFFSCGLDAVFIGDCLVQKP